MRTTCGYIPDSVVQNYIKRLNPLERLDTDKRNIEQNSKQFCSDLDIMFRLLHNGQGFFE